MNSEKYSFKVNRVPHRLPKIRSAVALNKEVSPLETNESLKTLKIENDSDSKIDAKPDPSPNLSLKTKQETHRLSFRKSKLESNRSTEERKKNIPKSEFSKPSAKDSKKPLKVDLPKLSNYNAMIKHSEIEDIFDTFEIKEISSESEDEENEVIMSEIKEVCIEISDTLILEIIENNCKVLVLEASKEMVSAALVLFSSSILDKYISEVLSKSILAVTRRVYRECTDIEYIEFRDLMIESVYEEEMKKIVFEKNLAKVASIIVEEYSVILPIDEIVHEAIGEEKAWNKEIIIIMGNHLIDCLIEEEWVEILAEDEINSLRLEQIWKILPQNLQKEMYKSHFEKIVENLGEQLYFDILNEIVGGLWVDCIANFCLKNEAEEVLDVLMPVKCRPKPIKKTLN